MEYKPNNSAPPQLTSWFAQIPGLILVMNKHSEFMISNHYTANLFGYRSEDALLGLNAFGMRCPAVESATDFIKQDQLVIESQQEITLLDIHSYADGINRVLLTKKKPLYQDNTLSGVICHCTEIQSDTLSKVCGILIDSEKKYFDSKSYNDRSYFIGNFPNTINFSKRELEVLFYYLRGKSAKTIAKILQLSFRTVENYIQNIKNKVGLDRKEDLIDFAISNGYFSYIPETILSKNISIAI